MARRPAGQAARPTESAALNRKAIELLQVVVESEPTNLSLRRELGVTLNNLGAALSRAQQESAALAAYQQAIDLREELVRLAPARATYRTDLAVSCNNLGLLENRQGRPNAAEAVSSSGRERSVRLLSGPGRSRKILGSGEETSRSTASSS